MGVDWRVQFSTGIMMVNGKHQIARLTIPLGTALANPRSRMRLHLFQSFFYRNTMRCNEPLVIPKDCNDRNGLRC